jgi:predicted nucleic acid-binding protein
MEDYADADLGFVDAAVTAIAERLAVTRIYTLDRRNFQLVKPAHVAAFEVLP